MQLCFIGFYRVFYHQHGECHSELTEEKFKNNYSQDLHCRNRRSAHEQTPWHLFAAHYVCSEIRMAPQLWDHCCHDSDDEERTQQLLKSLDKERTKKFLKSLDDPGRLEHPKSICKERKCVSDTLIKLTPERIFYCHYALCMIHDA